MWQYESDGGGWGNVWQPKTHYVTDEIETRIDCKSAVQARRMAKRLNEGTITKEQAICTSTT